MISADNGNFESVSNKPTHTVFILFCRISQSYFLKSDIYLALSPSWLIPAEQYWSISSSGGLVWISIKEIDVLY